MKILLGADPEVFISKGGIPHSAYGMIPGTKLEPFKVPDGAVQIDGTALEFNINPAETVTQWTHNLNSVLKTLRSMVPPEYSLDYKASVHYDWDYLQGQPEKARELGCDPDYNAYTKAVNPRPNAATDLRTAAGHIHIGWTQDEEVMGQNHFNMCCDLVKQLDFYLGIPSITLDTDTERRKLYGAAGAFRPKSYGVEYRVLSNFWLQSDAYMEWVFTQTHRAIKDLMEGNFFFKKYGYTGRDCLFYNSSNYFRDTYPSAWREINTFQHLLSDVKKAA